MAIISVTGPLQMKSTSFEVQPTSRGFTFTGRGYGHGVGLCVIGAGNRARDGATADEILGFYYPGLQIQQFGATALTANRPAPNAPNAPSAPNAPIAPNAPAAPAAPREAAVMPLVRRALDDIAAKAGIKAPASIRVTVHPDVEAFMRATGQPWWVSGATDKTGIDLAPLAILQQRGVVDRTIRREAAHALLDAALANKPQWVREGAASYFADPAAAAIEPSRRVACPADEELLRPLSAGTHREALTRADACFRRQIASGRSWREVR
jgi:hypothetical protein